MRTQREAILQTLSYPHSMDKHQCHKSQPQMVTWAEIRPPRGQKAGEIGHLRHHLDLTHLTFIPNLNFSAAVISLLCILFLELQVCSFLAWCQNTQQCKYHGFAVTHCVQLSIPIRLLHFLLLLNVEPKYYSPVCIQTSELHKQRTNQRAEHYRVPPHLPLVS